MGFYQVVCCRVEPGSGRNVFSVRFNLPKISQSDRDLDEISQSAAIRVSYGYAQYKKKPCASEGIEDLSYLDVDDLMFEVASTSSKTIAPTAMPSRMIPDYYPIGPSNNAFGCRNGVWIVTVAFAVIQLLSWI